MALDKHFNPLSNKIISVDEFVRRDVLPGDGAFEKAVTRGLIGTQAEWEDAAGARYFSEMKLKEFFSKAGSHITGATRKVMEEKFEGLQKILDACEDHTPRLTAGKLHAI